jgi:hypothetical protein
MNYRTAMFGLAALATTAIGSPASAAMPNGLPLSAQPQNVEQVRYVCNAWGRCFWRPGPTVAPTLMGRAGTAATAMDIIAPGGAGK